MYETKVVYFNDQYGNNKPLPGIIESKKKIVFYDASKQHLTITAIDPEKGTSIEVIVKKSDLPDFVIKPEE